MMNVFDNKNTLIIEGHQLTYYTFGKGIPMLLIHGITTYSFIWRQLAPHLSEHYQLIMVDLHGCGNSDKSINISYALKHQAKRMQLLTKRLKIDRFHLIGHDVGGGICQIMAVNNPKALLSLTLINTVAYDFWPVQPIIAMRTPIIRQFAMASLDMGALKFIVKRGLYHTEKLNNDLMQLFWKPLKTKEGRRAFLHFAQCLNNNDLMEISDELSVLATPTLIIRGDADVYLSEYISDKLANNIPNCKYERIATAGHFIQEDEPIILSYKILSFLNALHD